MRPSMVKGEIFRLCRKLHESKRERVAKRKAQAKPQGKGSPVAMSAFYAHAMGTWEILGTKISKDWQLQASGCWTRFWFRHTTVRGLEASTTFNPSKELVFLFVCIMSFILMNHSREPLRKASKATVALPSRGEIYWNLEEITLVELLPYLGEHMHIYRSINTAAISTCAKPSHSGWSCEHGPV